MVGGMFAEVHIAIPICVGKILKMSGVKFWEGLIGA
jgi:hypothetical protein